ncbi:carbohydrate sulfotransferase 3-like [Ptychodera flava]|uniref:carbohydrate sulfotransferase 3-like n=1 Tax=Ptychodera flava TaxID=63121 RepID=UPI00396A48EA
MHKLNRHLWYILLLVGIAVLLFLTSPQPTKIVQSMAETLHQKKTMIDEENSNNKSAKTPSKKLRSNILVMAGARTGSSFVGEFFETNPEIFYLFEPLQGFKKYTFQREMSTGGIELLAQIYRCDFANEYLREYFRWKKSTRGCPKLNATIAAHCCREANHTATKVIRNIDIRDFIPLMQDPGIDLKVINIVRDPRAMMSSLIRLHKSMWKDNNEWTNVILRENDLDEQMKSVLIHYCDHSLRNFLLKSADGIFSPWRKNLLILRFENIALAPKTYARVIYDFLDIKLHNDTLDWIDEHTQAKPMQAQEANTNRSYQSSNFSLLRNAIEVVTQWRKKVTFDLVKAIQSEKVCRKYMQAFNYTLIQNEENLTHGDLF